MTQVSLPASELVRLTSRHTGRSYELSIASPTDPVMGAPPASGYPLVVVLDAVTSLGTTVESLRLRSLMGELSPAVILGIGYDADLIASLRLRVRDLTPPTPADAYPELAGLIGNEFGGSSEFLLFLLEEAIPEVAARFRLDRQRMTLYGHSLAGLFVVETLLKRPNAFATYAAVSPSLWWNEFAVLRLQSGFQGYLRQDDTLPRVCISVGGREEDAPTSSSSGIDLEAVTARVKAARMIGAARDFASWLAEVGVPHAFYVFDGETHNSVVAAAIARSLAFALSL